jgi:hypothetical protein
VRLTAALAAEGRAAALRFATGFATVSTAMRLATALMPIAPIAVATAVAVGVADATAVMWLGAIAVDITVRAFAAFEQAFLSTGAIATATAASATTPAAPAAA